jgi:hypothetical protein
LPAFLPFANLTIFAPIASGLLGAFAYDFGVDLIAYRSFRGRLISEKCLWAAQGAPMWDSFLDTVVMNFYSDMSYLSE